MCDFSEMPKGFYVTASERREVGTRVHEAISDHTIYRPTSAQFADEVAKAQRWRDDHEADAKCADSEGDTHLASACRRVVQEVDAVLDVWRQRWREMQSK